MKTLEKLWSVAEQEANRSNRTFDIVLGDIGLFLQRPLKTWDYATTPVNSSTFASTGGEGVHFGLLHLNGKVSDDSPVVMTVPVMLDNPNIIVGENLTEFLSLGCEVGYFCLEQLAYDDQEAIERIRHPKTWADQVRDLVDDKETLGLDAFLA